MRPSAVVTVLASIIATGVLASPSVSSASGRDQPGSGPLRQHSLSCYAFVHGISTQGVPAIFRLEGDRASTLTLGPAGLGFQPRDVAYSHYPGDENGGSAFARTTPSTSHWFALSGPQLREVTQIDQRDASGQLVSSAYETRVVRKNWGGARQLSIGKNRDYLYVLTNADQLLRYRLTGSPGNTNARLDQVVGVGFGTLGTFEYTRTPTDVAGVRSDVFLASDADSGELVEISIPLEDPTAYTRTVLQTSGWTDMRSVGRMASCLNPTTQRSYDAIVGVDIDGDIRLWTDRDSRDGLGTDIVDRGVVKTSWRKLAYSD